jgi:hypothetical protein
VNYNRNGQQDLFFEMGVLYHYDPHLDSWRIFRPDMTEVPSRYDIDLFSLIKRWQVKRVKGLDRPTCACLHRGYLISVDYKYRLSVVTIAK